MTVRWLRRSQMVISVAFGAAAAELARRGDGEAAGVAIVIALIFATGALFLAWLE